MTERLEEIKTRFNAMKELESFKKLAPTDLFFDDLNWLLQQAERVEELERKHEYALDDLEIFKRNYKEKRLESRRYRQALERILENWKTSNGAISGETIAFNSKELARKALEGEE